MGWPRRTCGRTYCQSYNKDSNTPYVCVPCTWLYNIIILENLTPSILLLHQFGIHTAILEAICSAQYRGRVVFEHWVGGLCIKGPQASVGAGSGQVGAGGR